MKKTIDCIEMKRKGQESLRKRLAGMSRQQQAKFWADESDKLRELQQRLRANRRRSA